MSTMAPARTTTPKPDPAPVITWRDAITPLSQASRRRWTACYALLLALLAVCIVDDSIGLDGTLNRVPTILIVAPLILMGMLRRGTRRITALDHPDLDERDIAARNTAYRIAFPLLLLATAVGLALLGGDLPEITQSTHLPPPDEHDVQAQHGLFMQSEDLVALGVWVVLWGIFLPTGVLAWREPDAVEPEDGDAGGLPDALRDGLLGLALAASVAVSLIAENDGGLWLFVAALPLLGALARRAAGQPAMSRQRKWRVAIGVAMILALVVYVAIANASGG
ncbi:MAG: hypothetical protein H0W96_08470 [Solirubrobacterales bacterium]|nr:hypothetical protein [Solirubrobacterales bacterium]